jgi:hypothetical protein
MNAHAITAQLQMPRITSFTSLAARHTVWWRTALVMAALLAVSAVAASFDERLLNGVSVWAKPIKFALSLAVYFGTLVCFAPLMPHGYFATTKGRWMTWVPVICALLEMLYILFQASRGEASHFNTSTPFHAAMYSLMGAGAVALVFICLWMGVVVLRQHGLRNPYAYAVGLGLVLTFTLGGGFGGYLGGHMGHWVGGTASDANGLWLLRWSRDGGDLRVAHFFGMHAMQVLPLVAAALPGKLSRPAAIAIISGVAAAYALATTATFVQAVLGQPFI